jgi:hypothetical protein
VDAFLSTRVLPPGKAVQQILPFLAGTPLYTELPGYFHLHIQFQLNPEELFIQGLPLESRGYSEGAACFYLVFPV